MDIHNCVKMKDIKEWANEMQDLYKTYVLESELKQG